MKDFIIPNFQQSNLNISATLAEFLGAPNKNATLPVLKAELAKGYKNVDIFLNRESRTGESVKYNHSPLGKIDYYFDQANSDYSINTVFPGYIGVKHPERNSTFKNLEEFFDILTNICHKPDKQFVYAYYPEPDSTMHDYGVSSSEAKSIIESISQNIKSLYENMENTLFIVTADHGQIDVKGYVNLYEDEVLMDMLEIYPFLEARAPAFLVKNGREKEFEEYFRSKYNEDFVLYKSEDLIAKGYFGDIGDKASSLGDYIAIGTYTHKQAILSSAKTKYKGHHTSLTEEMEVPLILLCK